MSESNYVFMLRDGANNLEVQYNQQSEGVYLAEAQIFIEDGHMNGGCCFNIDNLEDMDRIISYLGELRAKMYKHYDVKAKNENTVVAQIKDSKIVSFGSTDTNLEYIPIMRTYGKCNSCQCKVYKSVEIENGLCFDCERKQIIKSADNFNPVSCMVCEGEFDNPMQKQLGICGNCQRKAQAGPNTTAANDTEVFP